VKKVWTALFAGALTLQVGGFYLLDRYLDTGAVTVASNVVAEASVVSTKAVEESEPVDVKVEPPEVTDDVQVYDIDADERFIAYADHRGQLIVKDGKQAVQALVPLENVVFLQWMDQGATVLYFRETYGMTEFGVLKVKEGKVVPLYDLPSRLVKIEQVYISPYSQSIHMLYRQDGQLYLGYYEAIYGYRSQPLNGIKIEDSWFDEKAEALFIREEDGTEWQFVSGRLEQVLGDERTDEDVEEAETSTE